MKGTHVDDVVGFGDGIEGPAVDLVATAHDVDFIAFGNRVRPHGLDHRVIGRILARWLDGVMGHPFSVPGQARRWSIRAVEDVHVKQFAGALIWLLGSLVVCVHLRDGFLDEILAFVFEINKEDPRHLQDCPEGKRNKKKEINGPI